jgi:hypothetical protein
MADDARCREWCVAVFSSNSPCGFFTLRYKAYTHCTTTVTQFREYTVHVERANLLPREPSSLAGNTDTWIQCIRCSILPADRPPVVAIPHKIISFPYNTLNLKLQEAQHRQESEK